MKLEVHETNGGIYVCLWIKKDKTWKIVAGPYNCIANARVGIVNYRKNHEKSFTERVGSQVMSKPWGEVVF